MESCSPKPEVWLRSGFGFPMEEEYGDEFLDDFGPAAKAKKLKKRKKKKKNKKELTPLEKMRDERLARKAGELVRRRRINPILTSLRNF